MVLEGTICDVYTHVYNLLCAAPEPVKNRGPLARSVKSCHFAAAEGSRLGIAVDRDTILDVQSADVQAPADLLDLCRDREARRRLDKMVRGQPPAAALRPADETEFLAPVQPSRIVLAGGQDRDVEAPRFHGPGARLPAGQWSPGVGLVVGRNAASEGPWDDRAVGFTPVHVADEHVALGPWVVGCEEVAGLGDLGFSAFLDDAPVVRPTKALLDWSAALDAVPGDPLAPGDILALVAPPQDAEGEVRAAMLVAGAVGARLRASLS